MIENLNAPRQKFFLRFLLKILELVFFVLLELTRTNKVNIKFCGQASLFQLFLELFFDCKGFVA